MAETKKKLVIGILAHVDAGKTTLTESMLYTSGRIRTQGRVDNGNAYLDTDPIEKARGITIFSKMAVFEYKGLRIQLMDTPGHVDFSAEMEKTLSVLDYAILVINGADGVQGHTETLWQLLKRYRIPVFLFVNKMDQDGTDADRLLSEIRHRFGDGTVDFSGISYSRASAQVYVMPEELKESVALQDERLMERYLDNGEIAAQDIRNLIWDRKLFPVFFGSALRNEGVTVLLDSILNFTIIPVYPSAFGARVFKIARDEQGHRLTFIKITGGTVKIRDEIVPGMKVSEIRQYSGVQYEKLNAAEAGTVCALMGIDDLKTGDVLGCESKGEDPSLMPVLDYRVTSSGMDDLELFRKLKAIEDEFSELQLSWDSQLQEIHIHLMGEVQTEVLKTIIRERLGVEIILGQGEILYKETISMSVEGIGHFEPLRHYAEVHLLMEPLPRGSGLQFRTNCSTDTLSINWQRLVLTHLKEKQHVGVLTGAPLTDVRITLVTGKAHAKHTEGGDFREATYRAVRQGLRKGESILLEPYYSFRLEIPASAVGRAMTDLSHMKAEFNAPEVFGENACITGRAAVSALRDYHQEVTIYTKGRGRLFLDFGGYDPCPLAEQVVQDKGYDPDLDIMNPCSSVFCAHGSGFIVPHDEVEHYMHLDFAAGLDEWAEKRDFEEDVVRLERQADNRSQEMEYKSGGYYIGDQELEDIFVRTYGPIRNKAREMNLASARTIQAEEKKQNVQKSREQYRHRESKPEKEYLLVDGYNIIYAWPELKSLAAANLDGARTKLMDIMSNYAGFSGKEVIVVFDAYRVAGHPVEQLKYHNIYEVYTREAMTADEYIEEMTQELKKQYRVTVATGDQVVQVITWGAGAIIWSAAGLQEEIIRTEKEIRNITGG